MRHNEPTSAEEVVGQYRYGERDFETDAAPPVEADALLMTNKGRL
ncbi:hypothetical protein [Xanthomonas translucens]|nr:hypothetical protein [Xanthomonas translucens]